MIVRNIVGVAFIVGCVISGGLHARGFQCAEDETSRPLSDFLKEQGKESIFFPPVPSYLGWGPELPAEFPPCENFKVDDTFALVDYAAVANDWIKDPDGGGGESLRTKVRGRVCERENEDFTATVTVKLFTRRALVFAQPLRELCEAEFDFTAVPTSFGNTAADVADGEKAALGIVTAEFRFAIDSAGGPLPDLLTELTAEEREYQRLDALSVGKCADGTPGILRVRQKAEFGVFSEEVVDLTCVADNGGGDD